jgi:hypothetical protein
MTIWSLIRSETARQHACTVVSVKESDLRNEIIATLNKQSEVILGKSLNLKDETSDFERYEGKLQEINQCLDKDGRVLKSLYESMVSGLISQSEFVQMKKDYESKIESLCGQADEIRNSRNKAKTRAVEFVDFADTVSAVVGNERLSADIIDKLIHEIRVRPEYKFDVHFRFRDEYKVGVA